MSIQVNNKTYTGNNIVINNNRVIIDGKDVTPTDTLNVSIIVDGNIESLSCDAANEIKVTGSVGYVKTMSGDVECGDVRGSVTTMSGDVECGAVSGYVSSMSGKIKHK